MLNTILRACVCMTLEPIPPAPPLVPLGLLEGMPSFMRVTSVNCPLKNLKEQQKCLMYSLLAF